MTNNMASNDSEEMGSLLTHSRWTLEIATTPSTQHRPQKERKISQLIAGYIDIILKKKQASEKYVQDVDEEAIISEDVIAPQRATPMQQNDQVTPIVPVPI